MVEQDVFGFDVAMHNICFVQVTETLEKLKCVHLNDHLVFDTAMLEQTSQRTTRAVFHEDVYLVPVRFDAVVLHNVGVIENLQHTHLVSDL